MSRFSILLISLMVLLQACDHRTARRTDYRVQGIDVSHHQSYIDWAQVADNDIHFAFVKATEGETFVDSIFLQNWCEMGEAGLRRGAYHFFRPTVSAEEQAHHFFRQVQLDATDLPPVLDVEVMDGASKVQLLLGIKTWLWMTEIHYGVRPIIYTSQKFYNKYLAGHFTDYPIWIARYNTRQPSLACGRDWQFWQYGNRGKVAGITGHVDLNVFRGSISDLDELRLRSIPQPLFKPDYLATRFVDHL